MASIFRPALAAVNLLLEHSNVTVTALTAAVILYTRSAGIAYFALGAVVCSRTVKAVKRFIRQPRPVHPSPDRQKNSYGMPSTHAAVITYYAAYTLWASTYLPIHPTVPDSPWTRIVVPGVVVPWATAIAVSRIWLGHHTVPQVLAGVAHGVMFTYMWYSIWLRGANDYGRYLEQTYFARP
ncbi:PAP2-domain-containing protein [Phanerochaete sordida]|uniref:PAP2-domain-containing protein n=1 Tax=Phanerochaete sordida TaxID=48140 RepID=A0A9P3L8V0_9APHY|nr:PAP2-domain-containing protein [Phanerochaete sordida]